MSQPSIKLDYGQMQIPEQDNLQEEENHWVVIKQLRQNSREQIEKKARRRRNWCLGFGLVGFMALLFLVFFVTRTLTQMQIIKTKEKQLQNIRLKNEPPISQKKIGHGDNINAKDPLQVANKPQDHNRNDRIQASRISPQVSQVPLQGTVVEQQLNLAQADHLPYKQHSNHEKLLFTYPTMGMKEPNTEFDFRSVEEGYYYYYESSIYNFLKPFNDTNCALERLGDQNDGGYPLCTNFLNQTEALINLGVEGRDRFGCDLTTRKRMPNYQYDCTNQIQPVCPSNSNSNFYSPQCLGEKTEQTMTFKYASLKDIIDSRNLTKKHVILKIDIEGAEWPGFRTFPREYLKYVDQIVMEIHNTGRNIYHQPYWGNLNIIEALQEHFIPVYLHMNPGACLDHFSMEPRKRRIPAFAIQVTLVNKEIITTKSASRAYRYKDREELYGLTYCDPQD